MLARPDSSGILRSLHRLGGGVPGLGAREKPAGNRGRSRLSRRRRARPARCDRARKPALGRRLAPAPRARRRRRQRRAAPAAAKTRRRCATRSTSRAPGADPGPAGRRLRAWRALTAGSAGQWRSAIAVAADALDVRALDGIAAGDRRRRGLRRGTSPGAVRGRAGRIELASRALTPAGGRGGAGELLAAWLADSVLAQKLKWPFALPLLAAPLFSSAGRRAPTEIGDGAETTRILFAWAKGAAHACDLAAELRRRAQKLAEAAPKLRAKGAKAALQALLDQDSLAAATPIAGLSQRGARRLFERLAALGAIRELTGRATFRLYGL